MNPQPIVFDALLPKDMAAKAENLGEAKVKLGIFRMFAMAVLAGGFIAMGAIFATTVIAGGGVPYGVSRLLAGLVFSLGLILVIVAGAELFTGNNLIVMAWASGKVNTSALLRNWLIVYVGNFMGSLATAYFVFLSRQHTFGDGAIGLAMLKIGVAKASLDFVPAVALGILCNALVCMAVWLCFSARTTSDKILCIIPPISAFVAAGFEHCVANMYFIPMALFVKNLDPTFFAKVATDPKVMWESLTWTNFLLKNLVPVTIGNTIGGTFMVGLAYWFIYLRPSWTHNPKGAIPTTANQVAGLVPLAVENEYVQERVMQSERYEPDKDAPKP